MHFFLSHLWICFGTNTKTSFSSWNEHIDIMMTLFQATFKCLEKKPTKRLSPAVTNSKWNVQSSYTAYFNCIFKAFLGLAGSSITTSKNIKLLVAIQLEQVTNLLLQIFKEGVFLPLGATCRNCLWRVVSCEIMRVPFVAVSTDGGRGGGRGSGNTLISWLM